MADRSIMIRIGANVAGLTAGLRTAATQMKSFRSQMEASATQNQAQWEQAGRALLGFGAIATAGFGATIKAASDWETAWTGVTKTVEGTPAQLNKVETGLRDLAKTLPSSHTEIAAVAEAAGQLGISTDNVVGFTKTMIDLGETTNLSADEAATSLARFANIMGTSQSEIDNVGSAIVGLGNNFATTESEITAMSLRIAGAGKQAGMSEGDVLGLATALSSVGIEAEAGGSAISQTMTKIGIAVDTNGDKLSTFAEVAGMSATEFSSAWREDAGSAMTAFITGLGDTERLGRSTNEVLAELGINGIREADSLRRLSSAQDVLNSAMAMGNEEYTKNNALAIESAKRYATSASQVKIAGNAIKDAMIDVGADFLPVLAKGAQGVANLANAFGDLPGPIKTAAGGLTGLVGGMALLAGGFVSIVPKIAETKAAFKTLGIRAKTAGILTGVAGGVITAAAVGFTIWAQKAAEAEAKTAEYAATLTEAGQVTEDTSEKISSTLSGSTDSWVDGQQTYIDLSKKMGIATSDMIGYVLGQADAQDRVNAKMDQYNAGASVWERITTARASQVGELRRGLEGEAGALSEAQRRTLQKAQVDAQAAEAQDGMTGATKEGTAASEEQTSALQDQISAMQELAGLAMSLGNSQIGYQNALASANKALKENGAGLDITTEKGRANKTALLGIADAAQKVATDMTAAGASGAEVAGQMNTAREDFIKAATAMGLSKREAKGLADQMGLIPSAIDIEVDANTVPARQAGESAAQYITRLKSIIEVTGNTVPARKDGESASAYIKRLKTVLRVDGNGAPARKEGESASAYIKRLKTVMKVNGDTVPARNDGESASAYIKRLKTVMKVDGDNTPAKQSGKEAQNDIDGRDATIDVEADTSGAKATWNSFFNSINGRVATVRQEIVKTITERKRKGKAGGGAIHGPGSGTSDDVPIMASNGEHVLTARDVKAMGGQGAVYAFRAALARGEVPGFASGGAVGSAERALRLARRRREASQRRLRRARRALSRANRTNRESDDRRAQKRVNALEKEVSRRDRKAQNQASRLQRLRSNARDTRLDLRRGNIRESATSGASGAYSVVDQMTSLARSGDLTGGQSRRLSKRAGNAEKSMRKLYRQADRLEAKLESARDRVSELASIKADAKSAITGGFSLGEVKSAWTGGAATTGQDYVTGAVTYAGKVKTFASKLKALQKKGYPGVILQEVAGLGVDEGIVAANALLGLDTADQKALTQAYKDIDKYAGQAGQYVTEGFYKGGVAAAQGIVKGLESQQKRLEKQILKIAKAMESALKKALGIKSPSRVFRGLGQQTADGLALGLTDGTAEVTKASQDLVDVPGTVAPSVYANPSRAGASNVVAVVDKGAMADAMNGVKMTLLVDGKPIEAIAQTTVDRNLAATATSLRGGRR